MIGKRIRELRMEKGLSQQELGDLLGVSKVSICGYEKGLRIPTMENFLQLIDILELTPDYLLGRDINCVSDDNKDYIVKLAKEDLTIIKEIKNKCVDEGVRGLLPLEL